MLSIGQESELPWMAHARKFIGLKEIKGASHNSNIVAWAKEVSNGAINDDETPWCGIFVGGILSDLNMPIVAGAPSARAWLGLPVKLDKPAYGSIVVFWRGTPSGWSGHVGFLVGKDRYGNLMVLGGNQGDKVSIAPFTPGRVLGYRWPSKYPSEQRFNLPVLASDGKVSTNEA